MHDASLFFFLLLLSFFFLSFHSFFLLFFCSEVRDAPANAALLLARLRRLGVVLARVAARHRRPKQAEKLIHWHCRSFFRRRRTSVEHAMSPDATASVFAPNRAGSGRWRAVPSCLDPCAAACRRAAAPVREPKPVKPPVPTKKLRRTWPSGFFFFESVGWGFRRVCQGRWCSCGFLRYQSGARPPLRPECGSSDTLKRSATEWSCI